MAHADAVRAVSGAFFHSMPTEHLPYSGFENIQPATSEPEAIATNSLAACAPKPVLVFVIPFGLRLPSGVSDDWPAAPLPRTPPTDNINGTVSVDGLAWVYVWDE